MHQGATVGDRRQKAEVGHDERRAYEAYLQGLYSVNQGEKEATLRKALAAFDQAIAEDPNYARAHAGRARALGSLASNGYEPFESGFGRAREAAERARALEPELAEAWLRLAYITYAVDLDIAKARGQYDRALALDPGSAEVQSVYANFAVAIGQTEKAIDAGSKAAARPDRTATHVALATAYYGRAATTKRWQSGVGPSAWIRTIPTCMAPLVTRCSRPATSRGRVRNSKRSRSSGSA
jgi:Tfp pilus assembly protein PilF